jgi:hypothetical protein
MGYAEALTKLLSEDQPYKEVLANLNDFGFSDLITNIDLVKKHKGDMNQIIDALNNPDA